MFVEGSGRPVGVDLDRRALALPALGLICLYRVTKYTFRVLRNKPLDLKSFVVVVLVGSFVRPCA